MPDLPKIVANTFLARAEQYEVLDSTNDRARQRVGQGGPMPLLIIADRQTAARGRGANRWWTGPGALAFTMALPSGMLPHDPRRGPLVALAAGVAVVDAIAPTLATEKVGLHWPNDVMVGRKKLSGVLVEAMPCRTHLVGIGLNTNNTAADAPPEIRERVTTLVDLTGRQQDHTELLLAILEQFAQSLKLLVEQPEELARRANERCSQIGHALTLWSGEQWTKGVCRGIAEDGALLLDTPEGTLAFYTGTLK